MNRDRNFKDRMLREKTHKNIIQRKQKQYDTGGSVPDRFGLFLSSLGNAQVARLFGGEQIQAKMDVSNPGDVYEQQADKIAGQMVQMKSGEKTLNLKINKVQAKGGNGGTVPSDVENEIKGLKGKGNPLGRPLIDFFEPRLGVDLEDVRIHTGEKANALARSLNARAFTYENEIVFRKGEFQPETTRGKKLIGHELVHTVQQGEGVYRKGNPPATQNEIFNYLWNILEDWYNGFKDGVDAFVTSALIDRIKKLESGSWGSFLLSLLGNTIWAATAFLPVGTAALSIFAMAMTGVVIGSIPGIPSTSSSKDDLIEILQELMSDYAFNLIRCQKDRLMDIARSIKESNNGIDLIDAGNLFIRATFNEKYITTGSDMLLLNGDLIGDDTKAYAQKEYEITKRLAEIDVRDTEYPELPGVDDARANWADFIKIKDTDEKIAHQYGLRMACEVASPDLAESCSNSTMLFTHRASDYRLAPTNDYYAWFYRKLIELGSQRQIALSKLSNNSNEADFVSVCGSIRRVKEFLNVGRFRQTMNFTKSEGIKDRVKLKERTIIELAAENKKTNDPSEQQLIEHNSLDYFVERPLYIPDYTDKADALIEKNLKQLENLNYLIDNIAKFNEIIPELGLTE